VDEKRPVLPEPCWVRLSEPCRLCVPGATGPTDCGLVYLVMTDPDLSAALARMRADRSREPAGRESVR
jgi:hypothetical protein